MFVWSDVQSLGLFSRWDQDNGFTVHRGRCEWRTVACGGGPLLQQGMIPNESSGPWVWIRISLVCSMISECTFCSFFGITSLTLVNLLVAAPPAEHYQTDQVSGLIYCWQTFHALMHGVCSNNLPLILSIKSLCFFIQRGRTVVGVHPDSLSVSLFSAAALSD